MTAKTGDRERWGQIRATVADAVAEVENSEMVIGRLFLELGDGSKEGNEALREELAAFFEEEALVVGALEREFRFLADVRRAMVEEMTLAEVQVARDLPTRAYTSALEKAAASSEISREQARDIVLRWFPDAREVLG